MKTPGQYGYGPLTLAFADADHGWLTDTRTLWSTGDGGGTWTRTILPVPPSVHGQLDVVTAPVVDATGHEAVLVAKYDATPGMDGARGQQIVYRTVDLGAHWTPVKILDDPGVLSFSLDAPTAWVAIDPSDPASVQTSTDLGVTWQTTAVRERWPFIAGRISFTDPSHGWMVVSEPPPPCPQVSGAITICDGLFLSVQHLVATDDGGATWHELKP